MRSALYDELAKAKIAANETADRITLNLRALEQRSEHASLFPDLAVLVLKQSDDLAAVIASRIAAHEAAEAKRAAEAQQRAEQAIQQAAAPATAPAAPAPVAPNPRATLDADPRFAAAVAGAPAQTTPADPDEPATLNLGAINQRLQCVSVTAAGLTQLGIEPAGRDKRSMLYTERQFVQICDAIARRVAEVKSAALQPA